MGKTDLGEESAHVRVDIFTESNQAHNEHKSSSHHYRQEGSGRSVHPGSRYRWSYRSSSTHHVLSEQGETNPASSTAASGKDQSPPADPQGPPLQLG